MNSRAGFCTRREFIGASVGAGAALSLALPSVAAGSRPGLVDANVTLFKWPGRRLPDDETPALVSRLRAGGITQAWAGTFDALLHKDLSSANRRLAEECRKHGRGLLAPFGSVNPCLPDWKEDLRRCHEEHRMRGVRLFPNYHGYGLDLASFATLLDEAGARDLMVQIAVSMEDERMQNPLLRVPPVDLTPLRALLEARPRLSVVLLNAWRSVRGPALAQIINAGRVFVEISTVESVGGVSNLLREIPPERVLFGSQAPFFYLEAALLKLKESELSASQLEAIRNRNARALFLTNSQ